MQRNPECEQQGGEEWEFEFHHLVPEVAFAAISSTSLILKRTLTMEQPTSSLRYVV